MVPQPDSPLPRFYARAFYLTIVALLGALVFRVLTPFVAPMLWAALLAFMSRPLEAWLTKRWRRPTLSAALITVTASVVIIAPVALFLTLFARQATELYSEFQAEAHDRKLPALQVVLGWAPVEKLLSLAGDVTSLSRDQLLKQATEAAQAALQQVASFSGSALLGAFAVLSQFFLTLFLLFFFVRDGHRMLQIAVRLVPMPSSQKAQLLDQMGSVTKAVVLGTLVTALVQGTLLGVGFAITDLPSPVVFGAIGALASLVPIVGTSLVWVPATLTLLAQGRPGWALFLAVWCVVLVAGSDNVVRPMIISGRANVSTLLVFIGVLGGVNAFGFAGFFVGPLLLSLIGALLRFVDESRMARSSDSQMSIAPVE